MKWAFSPGSQTSQRLKAALGRRGPPSTRLKSSPDAISRYFPSGVRNRDQFSTGRSIPSFRGFEIECYSWFFQPNCCKRALLARACENQRAWTIGTRSRTHSCLDLNGAAFRYQSDYIRVSRRTDRQGVGTWRESESRTSDVGRQGKVTAKASSVPICFNAVLSLRLRVIVSDIVVIRVNLRLGLTMERLQQGHDQ
jgi:hypothetical protein